ERKSSRLSLNCNDLVTLTQLQGSCFRFHRAAFRPALLGSMQAPAVGNILPGLHCPLGLKAERSRVIIIKSSGENSLGMKLIFSTPMPCSPVTLPPHLRHSSRISRLAPRTRFT